MEGQTRITVEHCKQKDIAKAFKCTTSMVSKALRGKKNTELAKRIRYVALTQYDGQEMQIIPQKKKETFLNKHA